MRTLCIDIGGSGIKAIVVDREGAPITERGRIETPRPATPDKVLAVIEELARAQGEFDRVSVGFPGVVIEGTTLHQCGATYYQPSGTQYVVVNVQ